MALLSVPLHSHLGPPQCAQQPLYATLCAALSPPQSPLLCVFVSRSLQPVYSVQQSPAWPPQDLSVRAPPSIPSPWSILHQCTESSNSRAHSDTA